MSLDAMKQALEALEQYTNVVTSVNDPNSWVTVSDGGKPARDAITALRAAIEQAQEPVAWMTFDSAGEEDDIWYDNPDGKLLEGWTYKPLYTAPHEWKGLTEEDVDEVERWIEFKEDGSGRIPNQKLVRYIERKLKEKNNG